CITRDEKVLKESSSGGVFSLLADAIIEKGGVVFGAAFDENWNVRHMAAQTKEDCLKFRGSKYVQSEIGDSFFQAKAFLDQGRPVLFSGAPCQIAGLNSFLGKKYPNLTTCDFICTGIPNPKAFRAYRDYFFHRFQEPLTGISFRDKKYGWDAFSMVFRGKSKEYRKRSLYQRFLWPYSFATGLLSLPVQKV
ncbi:MAG: coenzyme F420 hydrogenase/dehydrogenase beta subunit N-terminal domain-containing protein, partial [[Clostridium] leptum]